MAQTRSDIESISKDTQPATYPADILTTTNDLYGDISQHEDIYLAWWSIHLTEEQFQSKWLLVEQAVRERKLWYGEAQKKDGGYELKIYVPNSIRVHLAVKLYNELIQYGIIDADRVLSLKKRNSIVFEKSWRVEYQSPQLPEKLLEQFKNTIDSFALEYEANVDVESVGQLVSALQSFHREANEALLLFKRQNLSFATLLASPILHRTCEVTEALYEALHQLASANDAAFLDAMKSVANLLLAQLQDRIDAIPGDGTFNRALLQLKQQLSDALRTGQDLLIVIPSVMEVTTKTSCLLSAVSSRKQNSQQIEQAVSDYAQFSYKLNKIESARTPTVFQKIVKAVATVALAVVGFALGAIAGCAIGYALGAWTGPGAAVTAAIGLFKGGVTGSAIALTAGAAATSVAAGALGGYSLFKASPLPLAKACTETVATVAEESRAHLRLLV